MSVTGIPVLLQSAGKRVASVTLLSPDEGPSQVLPHRQDGRQVEFIVPRLRTYAVVAVE